MANEVPNTPAGSAYASLSAQGNVRPEEAKAICTAKEEEINNSMLVSALIFTVAASGILQPHKLNISGIHTDLYGACCILSLTSCLGSVMLGTEKIRVKLPGTLIRRQMTSVRHQVIASKHEEAETMLMNFITEKGLFKTQSLIGTVSWLMWTGAISITGALGVNTYQVLGHRSFFVMAISGGLIASLLCAAVCLMTKQTTEMLGTQTTQS